MNGLTIHVSDSYVLLKDHNEAQVVRLYFTDSIKPGKINSEHIEVNESLIFLFFCIVRLFVHPRFRKKGYATFAMEKFFEIHDEFNSFIVSAQPDDEDYMKREDLLNFYRKFGFEFLKENDEGTLMVKIKNNGKRINNRRRNLSSTRKS